MADRDESAVVDEVAPGATRTAVRASERERLLAVFTALVEPLGQALPESTEVVLHDLAQLPDSIVAVHGNVTGRRIGDPATDLLLQRMTAGELDHAVGYQTTLPDGRSMRSTTMIIKDSAGTPVAALCLNSDLSVWQSLHRITAQMIGLDPGAETEPPDQSPDATADGPTEVFARDVDELAAHLIHQAILEQQVPVDLMRKEHKLAVVRSLQARGMFLLRDAVEMIAASLGVTRFTIYNYLNEIADEPGSNGSRRKGSER
ncbi:helix-turn-helix transcriptional regulator [Ruania rhizosphaerae]|uniref:helix-turn-helix transcriptional regulator n=1 Tax=Ruania rhizosphaerae TaxID=1840413 RepID=UPI00135A7D2E|nr:PAS domain-containing protein [Ruania rhizosphaerae]